MKNVWLYGASDDCHEVETDFGQDTESYSDIAVLVGGKPVGLDIHYVFDGDWGIELRGRVPESWTVKAISANAPEGFRWREDAGQFLHIQIPDESEVTFRGNDEE